SKQQHIWEKLDKDEIDHIFASLEQCKTINSQFGEDRTNFNEIYLAVLPLFKVHRVRQLEA
ncbi:unnamed protein product, partial [Musa hybrid cultivar]